jgi:hypothetical protein
MMAITLSRTESPAGAAAAASGAWAGATWDAAGTTGAAATWALPFPFPFSRYAVGPWSRTRSVRLTTSTSGAS